MPSLHIAFPFAVWLCLLRFDTDGRWTNYRRILLVFVLMTAFSILYLGIHWFMDIIGGMVVATIAVNIANKLADPFWRIFDERTINARLVTLLTNPKRAFDVVKSHSSKQLSRFTKPTSRETGIMLTVVMIVVAGVITWDLTHQSIPAGGVDAPVGVEAADGWLITLDEKEEATLLVVHDLSNLNSEIEVLQPEMDENSTYTVRGDMLVMANHTVLIAVDLTNPLEAKHIMDVQSPSDVTIVSDDCFALLEDGQVTYWTFDGMENVGPTSSQGDSIILLESSNEQIALVFASDPDTVHLGIVDGEGLISIEVNATANSGEDDILIAQGLNVDLENATITDISFSENKLAATIDVNATSRLVLLDTLTGESQIISDHKFAAYDPHVDYGVLMFSAYTEIDPSNASSKYTDREIYIHEFSTNLTKPLTADDLDQWAPMVLEDYYVYQQMNNEGDISVEVQAKEPTLQPYSSNVLKFGVILVISLAFIYIVQKQREANSPSHHGIEHVS
tara:strand:- start:326 stop:1843 length:1518 start_codon:yes stop_codon:yes gene_type:complete